MGIYDEEINYKISFPVQIVCISFNFLSILLNIVMIIIMKKHSLFNKIFRNAVYSEGFMHFCMMIIMVSQDIMNKFNNIFMKSVGQISFIYILFDDNIDLSHRWNVSIFLSTIIYNLTMHLFIFLEFILMLKNPISSASFRTNLYFILSTIIFIICFFAHLRIPIEKAKDLIDIFNYYKVTSIVIFAVFMIMTFILIINLIYSIKRLGFKRFLKYGSYNTILLRQFFMAITFLTCYIPIMIVILFAATNNINILSNWFISMSFILFSGLGLFQFFFRISDTNFYTVLKISIMNMMCCYDVDLDVSEKNISDLKSKEAGVSINLYSS